MSDWRSQLRRDPRLVQYKKRSTARIAALNSDKKFILQEDRLRTLLKRLYATDPRIVELFVDNYGFPSPFKFQEAMTFVRTISDRNVKAVLQAYLEFGNRFQVYYRLSKQRPHFAIQYLDQLGSLFHVRVVEEHFEPKGGPLSQPNAAYSDYFEVGNLAIPASAKKMVDSGHARFVLVEDENRYSLLKDLESFAYHDDGCTFIMHHAAQPFLFCLFGEKATKEVLTRALKVVAEFQKERFGRVHAGRRREAKRIKAELRLMHRRGKPRHKAIDNVRADAAGAKDEKRIRSVQVRLAAFKREWRESITILKKFR